MSTQTTQTREKEITAIALIALAVGTPHEVSHNVLLRCATQIDKEGGSGQEWLDMVDYAISLRRGPESRGRGSQSRD
jgi:hypothetical protein